MKEKQKITIVKCELTGRLTVKWTDKDGYIHQAQIK